jgi:hypothetical protein
MKKKNALLPPQSSAEIKQKALESIKNPELQKLFEGILKRTSMEQDALESAEELKNEIPTAAKAVGTQMWLPVCPIPTDLCRVSPFFPMNRNDLMERPYIK